MTGGLGCDVGLALKLVAPYRMSGKRGKNDAADAAAICEAVQRPHSGREVGGDDGTQAQRSDLNVGRGAGERVGWQKAAVALANKNARILWAVVTKGEAFNPRHVSVKPGASTPTPTPATA